MYRCSSGSAWRLIHLGLGLRSVIGGSDHPHDRQAILTTDNGQGLVGNGGKKGARLLLKAGGAFSG